jgi:hypothetical protein
VLDGDILNPLVPTRDGAVDQTVLERRDARR